MLERLRVILDTATNGREACVGLVWNYANNDITASVTAQSWWHLDGNPDVSTHAIRQLLVVGF